MTVQIDTTAENNGVRLVIQGPHPSNPSAGHVILYYITGTAYPGMFVEDSSGHKYGPFITGTSSSSSASPSNVILGMADSINFPSGTVIPGLRGSADIAGAAGGGISYEFDDSTDPFTWSSAPTVNNSNSTFKSHYYISNTDNTSRRGLVARTLSGAFDIRAKLSMGSDATASTSVIGLTVTDSAGTTGIEILFRINSSTLVFNIEGYTIVTDSFTQRGSTWPYPTNEIYLRVKRDGSNNCSFYFSNNGLVWQLIATTSFSFSAAKLGFRTVGGDASAKYYAIDWVRSDV